MNKINYFIYKVKKAPAYANLVFNRHYGDWLINHKKFKKISYSPADMFFLQVKDGEFRRPDMIIRHLALDCYYANNNCGFDLYRKLQDARVKKGYAEEAVKKFRALIESYAENGYNTDSYILADKELKLRDGSHRMAMATYLKLPEITVAVFNATTALVLDYHWLLENGFSSEDIQLIRDADYRLRREMNVPVNCILWDSSKADEIKAVMNRHGKIIGCEKVTLTAEQLKKISSLCGAKYNMTEVTVVGFQLEEPKYLPLKFAQQPVFVQTAAVKKQLGSLNSSTYIPQNFLENSKLENILKNK